MDNENLMVLADISDLNDAIFSGKIKKRPAYIPSSQQEISFIKGGSVNQSQTINFTITTPKDQAILLSEAYFFIEAKFTATTLATSVATYVNPNLITQMLTSLNINTNRFQYTISNYSNNRAINVLSNIFRLRSYTPNQLALVGVQEGLTFAPVSEIISIVAPNILEKFSPTSSIIDINTGYCVANGFLTAVKTFETTYYFQMPLDCLMPILNRVKYLSGTCNISMTLTYDANNIFTTGAPTTAIRANPPILSTISEFTFKKCFFQYIALTFHEENPIQNIEKLTGLSISRQPLNGQQGVAFNDGSSAITTITSPPILVNGKGLSIIVIPRIAAKKGDAPQINPENVCDKSILNFFPCDNRNGLNCNFVLNPLFSINNYRCISAGGQIYPSNIQAQLYGSSYSSTYNFQNSFVQVLGNSPDGSSSNSALTINQYKNLFQVLVTDISNETTNNLSNNDSYNITFDLYSTKLAVANVNTTFDFDGDVFIVSARTLS